ncbi:MAG: 4Fe-4S binding protein [Firmicutes bacterium]|nr:4Fe-4S binding protein [Bacillota bacterium]
MTVDRKEKVWKVDEEACVKCGACLEKCPKECLSIG